MSDTHDDIYPVEELTADVITFVADRVAVAESFSDLIYRESEIDALWSLADIAARDSALANAPGASSRAELRDRIGQAHDLVPEGRCAEAAEILRNAAALLTK